MRLLTPVLLRESDLFQNDDDSRAVAQGAIRLSESTEQDPLPKFTNYRSHFERFPDIYPYAVVKGFLNQSTKLEEWGWKYDRD
jgi:hypothetical protein